MVGERWATLTSADRYDFQKPAAASAVAGTVRSWARTRSSSASRSSSAALASRRNCLGMSVHGGRPPRVRRNASCSSAS